MTILRYIVFQILNTLGLILVTLLLAIFGLLMPIKRRVRLSNTYNFLVTKYFFPLVSGKKIIVEGLENLPKTSYIGLSHHSSTLETVVLHYYLQPVTTVLRSSLFFIPFFGWSMAMLQPISINREKRRKAIQKILGMGASKLNNGLNILLFPEGSRLPSDRVKKINKTGFKLAATNNTPIVPIIHNAGFIWPAKKLIKRGAVIFKIGKPITCTPDTIDTCVQQVTQWMESELELIKPRN